MPTITWRKINGNIPKKARLRKSQAVLEIPNIQLEDSGTYECKAENPRGGTAFKGHLQVYSESQHALILCWFVYPLLLYSHHASSKSTSGIVVQMTSSLFVSYFGHSALLPVILHDIIFACNSILRFQEQVFITTTNELFFVFFFSCERYESLNRCILFQAQCSEHLLCFVFVLIDYYLYFSKIFS